MDVVDFLLPGFEFLGFGFMVLFLFSLALALGECLGRDFYKGLKVALRFFRSLLHAKKKEP